MSDRPKISACLIVHNEEKLIERCLKSLEGAVDEILIVHDGECTDRTLEIAKNYTDKIFVRQRKGIMEEHIPFCFNQALGKWLLRIDADEYLSKKLKVNLKNLAESSVSSAFEFFWPIWSEDKLKYLTNNWPYKLCFYRKDAISFLAVPHFIPLIKGGIVRSRLRLEHRPLIRNDSFKALKTKYAEWAKIQASTYLKSIEEIPKFNYEIRKWPLKIKIRIRYPILLMPFEFFLTFFKNLSDGGWKEGVIGLRIALTYAIYRVMVNFYIHRYKNRN